MKPWDPIACARLSLSRGQLVAWRASPKWHAATAVDLQPVGNSDTRTLRGATDAANEPAEGDGLLLLGDVVEEGNGTLELPAVDRLGGFPRVLERDTEVRAAGARRLGGRDLLGCVSNLRLFPKSAITVLVAAVSRAVVWKKTDRGVGCASTRE